MAFRHFLSCTTQTTRMAVDWGIHELPTTALINPDGNLVPNASLSAIDSAPSHSTSNETFACTGKTAEMGGVGSPSPCVSELARSWSSKTSMPCTRSRAHASSKSTSTASCLTGIIQNGNGTVYMYVLTTPHA